MIRQPDRMAAHRLYNLPLALSPLHASQAMLALMGPIADAPAPADPSSARGYAMIEGVAIIPVQGVLVHRLGSLTPWCGLTGYDGIRRSFINAMQDASAHGVMLAIDSPGGECAGLFDLADLIFSCRDRKPVWAVLDEDGFSGGYALASACSRVCVPRTGGTGSIGILAIIPDISSALDQAGMRVNVIQFGKRKADGLPEIPLAPAARARFQADVDTLGRLFVSTVARNRRLSTAALLAQEADTFLGAEGVTAGLADMVAEPSQALQAMLAELAAGKAAQLARR